MASLKKRGNVYYAQYYRGNKAIRVSLRTTSLQIAKEKLRKLESSLFNKEESLPFPTKTPISEVVSKYITYMEGRKTARSVVRDIAYLRDAFGPVCPALALKKPAISAKRKEKDKNPRGSHQHIDSACFEQITTSDISSFIAAQVRRKALAPKTANRYREILTRG